MTSLATKPAAKRVWFDSDNIWVELVDGRQLAVPLTYFPRLLNAQPDQREQFEMSGAGTGLHWEQLDEDISVEGLLLGIGDQTRARGVAASHRHPLYKSKVPRRMSRTETAVAK